MNWKNGNMFAQYEIYKKTNFISSKLEKDVKESCDFTMNIRLEVWKNARRISLPISSLIHDELSDL